MNAEYLDLAQRVLHTLPPLSIERIYLPEPVADETFRDEFGFVFLSDGSIGPFYVSLGGLLPELWQRFPEPLRVRQSLQDLLLGFGESALAARAPALGVFNALSRSLLRRSGFSAPDRVKGSGLAYLSPDAPVGMVGYFCPLIDKLVDKGMQVRVLEHAPERIPDRPGVTAVTEPEQLRGCRQILCTSSVLINDSLDALLAALAPPNKLDSFELIGPSGSGLPDVAFARGVSGMGGIVFDDAQLLLYTLARRESWGAAGQKYQITPQDYPGVDALLDRLAGASG